MVAGTDSTPSAEKSTYPPKGAEGRSDEEIFNDDQIQQLQDIVEGAVKKTFEIMDPEGKEPSSKKEDASLSSKKSSRSSSSKKSVKSFLSKLSKGSKGSKSSKSNKSAKEERVAPPEAALLPSPVKEDPAAEADVREDVAKAPSKEDKILEYEEETENTISPKLSTSREKALATVEDEPIVAKAPSVDNAEQGVKTVASSKSKDESSPVVEEGKEETSETQIEKAASEEAAQVMSREIPATEAPASPQKTPVGPSTGYFCGCF